MEVHKKSLGKVVMTPEGAWDQTREYEILSLVYHDTQQEHLYLNKMYL